MIVKLSLDRYSITKSEGCQVENEFSSENLKNGRISKAVSVTAELLLERGIEDVKMTDIADESGVGVATLYRYFGTKPAIVAAAMTFLWEDLKKMFGGVFDSENFTSQDGIKQIRDLMRMFIVMYTAHKDFMRLVGEFDSFIIREKVPKEELEGYDRSLIDFYPVVERACKKGIEDGTVRSDVDFGMFYRTYTHALNELCKKFIIGELLPSDDFSNAERELETLIDTAIYYLQNNKGAALSSERI